MKKIIATVICVFVLFSCIALPIKSSASTMAMKNWQQDEPSVPGYVHGDQKGTWWYKVYGGGNFGDTGCGIMSLVNAVHYVTGNFMDPLEVADWAYNKGAYSGSWGTERSSFYPYVEAQFGAKYGFKITNTGTYGRVDDAKFIDHLKNGGTAVVHVQGHFMAVVEYDETTKKYLLWDNCAGDGRGGHRAGATHIAGDWLTADELEGSINKTYLTVDWYCLVSSATSSSVAYKETTGRESIYLGFSEKLTSGTPAATTTVTVGESNGMTLTVNGWHGTTHRTRKYGYSVDGGAIVYDLLNSIAADQTTQNAAVSALGTGAIASKFSISIPLTDNKAHMYKIYAKDGSHETCIWTINKKMSGTFANNTYGVGTIGAFTGAGSKYAIRIYQNSTSDASYTSGWGGSDGISNKTLTKDAVLYIFGALKLNSKDCRRVGLLVDNSYIVWPQDKLVKSAYATRTDCYIGANEALGNYGFMFDLSFDTSRLSSGNHTLKLVMQCGTSFVEIGTRTKTYGGGCFTISATSSGSKYVPEATPAPTKAPTEAPKVTSTPAPKVTQTPVPCYTNTPGTSAKTPGNATPSATGNVTPSSSDDVTPVPTGDITENPSGDVTEFPTADITEDPTADITEEPTGEVTDLPSEDETQAPTDYPEETEKPSGEGENQNTDTDVTAAPSVKAKGCGGTISGISIILLIALCAAFFKRLMVND